MISAVSLFVEILLWLLDMLTFWPLKPTSVASDCPLITEQPARTNITRTSLSLFDIDRLGALWAHGGRFILDPYLDSLSLARVSDGAIFGEVLISVPERTKRSGKRHSLGVRLPQDYILRLLMSVERLCPRGWKN